MVRSNDQDATYLCCVAVCICPYSRIEREDEVQSITEARDGSDVDIDGDRYSHGGGGYED